MTRAVHDDLNRKTLVKQRRQVLSTMPKEKRLSRATVLLDALRHKKKEIVWAAGSKTFKFFLIFVKK